MSRYAAVDIGSNSIRMLVAEVNPSEPTQDLAVDRQVVRLGAGVFREGRLTQESMDLSFQVLQRMSDKIGTMDVLAMRVVGTSALRDAPNQKVFLERAAEILKTPVEVISGLEEARLIHLGVQSRWSHPRQRLLILDIGGGSAELILGEAGHFVDAFSKPLGAVRLTEMFLKSDPADPREIARMERYVQERLAGASRKFTSKKPDRMIGTSATSGALVSAANQIRRAKRDEADRTRASAAQVRRLYRDLAARTRDQRNKITGIGPRRSEIIVAGACVMSMVLGELDLPSIYYSTAGLREGVVADLAHRKVGLEQARLDGDQLHMVRAMVNKYGISAPHVQKVADLAHMLFEGLRPLHELPIEKGRLLEAAGFLYNIGHYINEQRHHRHSMYIVANSDMPGFSDEERLAIANLCRYHRKSTPQLTHDSFQALGVEHRRCVMSLTPLLRIAVALDQGQQQKVERVEVAISDAVELRLYSKNDDIDIEQWHAQQVAELFHAAYGKPLIVRIKK